jgi:hypothetical protein
METQEDLLENKLGSPNLVQEPQSQARIYSHLCHLNLLILLRLDDAK